MLGSVCISFGRKFKWSRKILILRDLTSDGMIYDRRRLPCNFSMRVGTTHPSCLVRCCDCFEPFDRQALCCEILGKGSGVHEIVSRTLAFRGRIEKHWTNLICFNRSTSNNIVRYDV